MQSDLPHTLYIKDGEKKVTKQSIDKATQLMLESQERRRKAREQKKEKERMYTVDDIFNGVPDNE